MQLQETNRISQGFRTKEILSSSLSQPLANIHKSTHVLEDDSEYSDPEFDDSEDEEESVEEEEATNSTSIIINQAKKEEINIRSSCQMFLKTQTEIKTNYREVAVKWLLKLHYNFHLANDVLFNAITYFDILLSNKKIPKSELQLYAVVCYWVSAKVDTRVQPSVAQFNNLSGEHFTNELFSRVEIELLGVLGYKLSFPTSKFFMRQPLTLLGADEKVTHVSRLVSEVALIKFDFMDYRPSINAAASVIISFACLGHTDKAIEMIKTELLDGSNMESLLNCTKLQCKYSKEFIATHKESSSNEVKSLFDLVNMEIDFDNMFQIASESICV
ncbi:Cyclin, N-terminal domain containing protein [Tritrichomonas foetus]|uniref:Cyclin, N-terminal domain containing protein n=1 Tax=Tritrichomonas foetus TaxID=1144522 RepID=A0A1J4L015_9EUKA|nr:Cyclin, N-terminal domain containing protein [Tritrichomonas foetus]|eukprot:OHT16754.1 Cyclin, N-terminal domain containing protein [Tritrichomonas foetus]